MQFKETLVRLFFILTPSLAFSQTTYLPLGDKANILLERLEIKRILRENNTGFREVPYELMNKPYSRKVTTEYVEWVDSIYGRNDSVLSRVDRYNLNSFLMNNLEWVKGPSRFTSKKPIAKNFYRTPANLYEVHVKDFDLVINPMIRFTLAKESDNDENLFTNSRGVGIRGRIANKIGFAASIVDNQERAPKFVQQWEDSLDAVPGHGYYKDFKGTGFDYFDARGYFTFNITKYIDVQFGYDKNFIGDGQRSLFLSDFSNNMVFLKLNTRIWRINYQNLFMELQQTEPRGPDRLLRKKYAAFHHLDVNITKWLNIGLFEGVMFGRSNRFEFGYLNPVIFYRSIEQQNGSFDNSVAGIDFKANAFKHFQFYGQFLLDEFNFQQIRRDASWWANKWGLQLGAKYIDAFKINNLDLQLEWNRVRPFTYSHRDSVANYTHYNQPLAHPLGANFNEVIAVARYQPAPKWTIEGKIFYWQQGRDTGSRNFGSDIFLPNIPPFRQGDFGYTIVSGVATKTALANLFLTYELRENLFIDFSLLMRKYTVENNSALSFNSTIISGGIRWNMSRRVFEF